MSKVMSKEKTLKTLTRDKIEFVPEYSSHINAEQILMDLFRRLDIEEIVMDFDAGGDSYEYTMATIKSRTYDMEKASKEHVAAFENIHNLISIYIDSYSGIEIYEVSDGCYIGESGSIRIWMEDDGDYSHLRAEKDARSYYSNKVAAYITDEEMDKEDKEKILELYDNTIGSYIMIPEGLIDRYQWGKENDKQYAIGELSNVLLENDHTPDKILFKENHLNEVSTILLKYLIRCREQVNIRIDRLIGDGYDILEEDNYDPEIKLLVESQYNYIHIEYGKSITSSGLEENDGVIMIRPAEFE